MANVWVWELYPDRMKGNKQDLEQSNILDVKSITAYDSYIFINIEMTLGI